MHCPVCGEIELQAFLTREAVPAHQNLLLADAASALSTTRGDLHLACCPRCGFVFNSAFDSSRLAYGQDYDNTQDCSPAFSAYVDGLVAKILEDCGNETRVVEVGCGKGSFLRRLVEVGGGGVAGHGFDPSYDGPLTNADGLLRFDRCFYGPEWAHEPADVVVCRHVIEHVGDPIALLRSMRDALRDSPKARLYLETPCVEWILQTGALWDLFYEHCSYFAPSSLRTALVRAGFAVESITHTFGGQYLWAEATLDSREAAEVPDGAIVARRAHPKWEQNLIGPLRARVAELAVDGPVALWGAGAKGVTLANVLDPEASFFACVVDLNPKKQGRYIAGTGHRIVGPLELPQYGVKTCLLMNPNYAQEVSELLGRIGAEVSLVDISEEGVES